MGVEDVLAGTSGSLLDHPNEFSESRKTVEVILTGHSTLLEAFIPTKRLATWAGVVSTSRYCPVSGSNSFWEARSLDPVLCSMCQKQEEEKARGRRGRGSFLDLALQSQCVRRQG